MLHCVVEMQHNFQPTKDTICKLNTTPKSQSNHIKEYYHAALSWSDYAHEISFCDVVSFFFASIKGNYYNEKIDFTKLLKEEITLCKTYDYTHIIPPIATYKMVLDNAEQYRAIIDEYCMKIKPKEIEINKDNKKEIEPTYIQKILYKIKRRTNKQYLRYKLLKVLGLNKHNNKKQVK